MRVPMGWREPIEHGRGLLLSPFEKKYRRATADIAQKPTSSSPPRTEAISMPLLRYSIPKLCFGRIAICFKEYSRFDGCCATGHRILQALAEN